jgi:aldose 1-epimerase
MPYAEEQDVEGTEYDFRSGQLLAGVDLDTAFGGLGDGPHEFVLAHGDQQLVVWTGPDFRWAQVFTPDDLVGRGRAVAIEPMTCPADALNSGTDLIELAPGETWSGSWGVVVHPGSG